jgi:hypothetical protein
MKRVANLCLIFLCAFGVAFAQDAKASDSKATPRGEKTVEEEYLAESYEGQVMLEHARSDSKSMKQDALLYIEDAIKSGKKNEDVYKALETLTLDGVTEQSRAGGVGRVLNNFPDIRAKGCELLGQLGTVEARNTLVKVVYADNEPMVQASAIRALGKVGDNTDEKVTEVISYIVTRYDVIGPDNTLAYEAIIAVARLAKKNSGLKDRNMIKLVMRIADGNYITPVKKAAKIVLSNKQDEIDKLLQDDGNNKDDNQQKSSSKK